MNFKEIFDVGNPFADAKYLDRRMLKAAVENHPARRVEDRVEPCPDCDGAGCVECDGPNHRSAA